MKTVSRAVKTSCILAAVWCLGGLALPMAQAQVLDQLPSDSLVVLKLNHLQDTNKKVSDLLTSLGITDLVPTTKNPIESLETQLGVGPGLDTKGDAAAVLLNGQFEKGGPPPFALLLPVSDYKAFLGSTTVVRTEGDISVVHFKENEDDVFVANWGSYAALSDKKENLTVKHEGLKIPGVSSKQMDAQDACVYVNFPVLKGLLGPQLKKRFEEAKGEMTRNITDPAKLKLADTAATQVMNVVTEFLNDAQGTTIGLNITPEGISETLLVEVTPDSYIGKFTTGMKNSDGPMLAGLPKENYLFFGGSVEDPAVVTKIINDVAAPILTELAGMGDDGKKLADTFAVSKDAFSTIEGGAIGVVAPTAALGQGSLLRFIALYKGDAEKLKAADAKSSDIQNQLMKTFGLGQTDMMKSTVTPDFKTINGVKFDRIQAEINPDNTSQEAMRASEMMSQIYGPDGFSMLNGAVDPKTLVVSLGIDDDLMGQVVDAAKGNKDILTDGLKAVDSSLPKKRVAVAYLGLGQIAATGLSYAKANGMNVGIQLPNNLPPIAFSASTDGPTMRGDLFIPMKLLQSMVQAGLQVYMQFNNRNGGGGGGGL